MTLKHSKILTLLCAAIALILLAPMALAEDGAPAIRLERPEGTVTVLNAAGQTLDTQDGLALTGGGETVITGADGKASSPLGMRGPSIWTALHS